MMQFPRPMLEITPYSTLREVAPFYDGFLLDLWGVIHDGEELYPQVIEALAFLRGQGKKIIFLSNAPRRAEVAAAKLTQLGIAPALYDEVMTSGEAVFTWIRDEMPFPRGSRYLMIGPTRDDGLLDGLDYHLTRDPAKAQFVVVTGYDDDLSLEDEKMPDLLAARKYNLPLICVNPDHVIVRRNGQRSLCAGVIADQYRAMGGEVHSRGKPYKEVYTHCFERFSALGVESIVAIGDNLDTDIKGALAAGIDSILIAGGILEEALGCKHGEMPNIAKLTQICQENGSTPKGVLPAFIA